MGGGVHKIRGAGEKIFRIPMVRSTMGIHTEAL